MSTTFYPSDVFWMALTLLVSVALSMLPLSTQMQLMWPDFCLLTLIYWSTHRNNQGFIFVAFLSGLLMDILNHNTMGVHAIVYTLSLFLLARFFNKFTRKTFLRQIEIISMLLFFSALLTHVLLVLLDDYNFHWKAVLPVIFGIIIWPWITVLYNALTRKSHHSNNA